MMSTLYTAVFTLTLSWFLYNAQGQGQGQECWEVQPGVWGQDPLTVDYVDSLYECQEMCLNSTTTCFGIDYDEKDLKGNSQCHTLKTMNTIPDKTQGHGHVHIRVLPSCLKLIGCADLSKLSAADIRRCFEIKPIKCVRNPCLNGGSCVEDFVNQTSSCNCLPQYSGTRCEIEMKCLAQPCLNGGTCEEHVPNHTYICTCLPQYTGTNCENEHGDEKSLQKCSSQPCLNGGTCEEDVHNQTYSCTCLPHYLGTNCETVEPGPCKKNPCMNGGTCVVNWINETYATYKCNCSNEYTGVHCEIEPVSTKFAIMVITLVFLPSSIFLILCLFCVGKTIRFYCRQRRRDMRNRRQAEATNATPTATPTNTTSATATRL